MKSQDNFKAQIDWMKDTIVTNTVIAETINTILKKIDPQVLNQSIEVLIKQYQGKYPQTYTQTQEQKERIKEQKERLQSIKRVLYLVKREQVTNIDELNLNLANQINSYYGIKDIQPKKQLSFYLQCQYCTQYVSNYQLGLKKHQFSCLQKNKEKNNFIENKKGTNNAQDNFYQSQEQIVQQQLQISKRERLNEKKKGKQLQRKLNSQDAIRVEIEDCEKDQKQQQRYEEDECQNKRQKKEINKINFQSIQPECVLKDKDPSS